METLNEEGGSIVSVNLLQQTMELILGGQVQSVETDEQQNACIEMFSQVKATAADLDAERDSKVRPLNEKVAAINAEYNPLIKQLIGEKKDSKSGVAGNLNRVAAEYQAKKDAEAKRLEDIEQAKVDAEKQRLAEIEDAKLKEADAKLKAAEAETDAVKKVTLINEAEASEAQAVVAAQQAVELDATPVTRRRIAPAVKVKYKYTAEIDNYRQAMAWIVENNEWATIESTKFEECVQSAMNKIAGNREDKFSVPGCKVVKTAQIGGKRG